MSADLVSRSIVFQADVEDMLELSEMKNELLERVSAASQTGCEYCSSFEKYSYLWVDDRQEFLQQFLRYGHVVTQEEIDQAGDDGVQETPPTLTRFKEQVDFCKNYHLCLSWSVCLSVRVPIISWLPAAGLSEYFVLSSQGLSLSVCLSVCLSVGLYVCPSMWVNVSFSGICTESFSAGPTVM